MSLIVTVPLDRFQKGKLAEEVLISFLEGRGCTVTRTGVEHAAPDLCDLPADYYHHLKLPPQLRFAPDLFVRGWYRDPHGCGPWVWCRWTEVKFRSKFDCEVAEELFAKLKAQRGYCDDFHTVLMNGDPDLSGLGCLRVIPPGEERLLTTGDWNKLPRFREFFPEYALADVDVAGLMESAATMAEPLHALANGRVPEGYRRP